MWSIGNGNLVNFWNDCWENNVGPLKQLHIGRANIDKTLRVCDVVSEFGLWNWSWLESQLPHNILIYIAAIMPQSYDSSPDCVV